MAAKSSPKQKTVKRGKPAKQTKAAPPSRPSSTRRHIEEHTRLVERWILIDQSTRGGLPDSIAVEALGPVLFRGKRHPIHIFAVNGAR